MPNAPSPYWRDVVSEALDVAALEATDDQIAEIAEWVESAHDMHGEATGLDVVQRNFTADQRAETQRLKDELLREREKVTCRECGGRGEERIDGPAHYSIHECWKCHGAGRHDP